MHAARLKRKAVSDSAVAMDAEFYAYGEKLERVEVFKYLRRLITFDDDDTQAVRGNLARARCVWARISRVLRAEKNASTHVCGMFYKATVQSVLLFGSKTWVLSPATLKRLEGFHAKAARRMTGLLPKLVGGSWKFPKTNTVLATASLHTIEHYVQVRRAHIMRWVIDRPILKLCRMAERRRGTTPRLYWWEQSMELDDASAGVPLAVAVEGDIGDEERAPYPLDVKKPTGREALRSTVRTGNVFGQIVLGLRTFRHRTPERRGTNERDMEEGWKGRRPENPDSRG